MADHGLLVGALVKLRILEGDRERAQRRIRVVANQGDDGRGIQAAAQVGTDRHVSTQLQAHGIDKQIAQRSNGVIERRKRNRRAALGKAPVPVAGDGLATVFLNRQQMPGRQAAYPFKNGIRLDRGPERQCLHQSKRIDAGLLRLNCMQRLDLGGEPEAPATSPVEQRANADAVAHQQQAAALGIPQCNGELAVEVLDKAFTIAVVEVQDDFGVGFGAEPVPHGQQRFAQFDVVEDLTVEAHPDAATRIAHRLGTIDQINDGQARMGQADAPVDVETFGVRSAMRERRDHRLKIAARGFRGRGRAQEAGYATHGRPTGKSVKRYFSQFGFAA